MIMVPTTSTPGTERSGNPDLFTLAGQFLLALAILLFTSGLPAHSAEPSPHKVLLLDGQNNHDWRSTTPLIKSALERTGRFAVTVATSPATSAPASAWAQFHPNFKDYAAVVSNYTDFGAPPTPTKILDDLTAYVRDGGSLVIVHAANSGMNHYPEFARLVGMGWSMTSAGSRLYLDDSGKTIRQTPGQGPATAHGKPFAWPVTIWATDHPICAGMPRVWLHETDELWAAPRGPAENVEILATAVPPETQQNDPVLWTVRYGKGRVFVTLLGHDANAMRCVGFQTTLARGCEWVITGRVTLSLPNSFPTADKTSLTPEKKAEPTSARIVVVTGLDYPGHPWKLTSPLIADALRKDKRLTVEIREDPKFLASPKLHDYDVLVLNYMNWESPDPGPDARENLRKFVASGKGFILVHFTCGAFQAWPDFRTIAGRVYDPKLRPHDPRGPFHVDLADKDHPITKGLQPFDTDDELYTCLTGNTPIHILATARSKVDDKDYPIAFVLEYGKGRVFHTVLGHDVKALTPQPVQDLFRRAAAWTANLPVIAEQ